MKNKRFNWLIIGVLLFATTVFAAKFSENFLIIGKGLISEETKIISNQPGSSDPFIKFDPVAGKWFFTNDGIQEKAFGTGSGGGGGEGFNNAFGADDNANAEDTTTGWTNTGGTFTTTTSDPLEGERSFTFLPTLQNQEVSGPLLNVDKDIFKGRACQAQIEYVGGDENLELRILDLGGNTFKSMPLPAHSISAAESIYFLCPSATEIAGDANLAQLRLQLFNVNATAAPLIKWDKSYLGTLIGLSESVLPNILGIRLNAAGVVVSDDAGIVNSVITGSTATVVFNSGFFTVPPLVICGKNQRTQVQSCGVDSVTTGGFTYEAAISQPNEDVYFLIMKQGADAKQAVQVYKSIPKVSENINSFSARTIDSGTVSNENVDWIQGNASSGGAGIFNYTFVAGTFSTAPACTVSAEDAGTVGCLIGNDITATTLQVYCQNTNTNGALNRSHYIHCQKQEGDFKMPTVQPVLVNQVETTLKSGLKLDSCYVSNAGGTATLATPDCSTWISIITDNGTGSVDFTFATPYKTNPRCFCNVYRGNGSACTRGSLQSNTSFRIETFDASGPNTDMDFEFVCIGER